MFQVKHRQQPQRQNKHRASKRTEYIRQYKADVKVMRMKFFHQNLECVFDLCLKITGTQDLEIH